jgi:serine/threonine protein kinase
MTELVGGRYEIQRALGQGAFGHTFLARDTQADRSVALKVLDARARADAKAFELFRREADVLRALRHHGIPEIFDSFTGDWYGTPTTFLVMEYVEGTSLAAVIDEKRAMDGNDIVHLFLELLGILDYLHGRVPPILHRDIKPSNIVVRPNGFPALVDFGSVRRVFMSADEGGSTVAGTYGYMPYEQYMGQATPSSDLYALAATFLHLLTGRPPRDFMNEDGRIQVPDALPGEPRLRTVLARLLRPSPAERYASARDVRNALVGGGPTQPAAGVSASVSLSRPGAAQIARTAEAIELLPPAPRALEGETRVLFERATPTTMRLMTASEKPSDERGLMDLASLIFFSTITMGLIPLIFGNIARLKRNRMRRFFAEGIPGSAQVVRLELETMAFDEKLVRVNYQFEADGELHRDSDTVLPTIADRIQPGDRIPILYMPQRGYDSVIVAVE